MKTTLNKITLLLFVSSLVPPAIGYFRAKASGAVADANGWRTLPKPVVLKLENAPLHRSTANTVLVEFSDYQCPFCRRHANTVYRIIIDKLVATGKIQYAFVNNPLPDHPQARRLAAAAWCAGQQGQYWEAHDFLFRLQDTPDTLEVDLADELNLDVGRLRECAMSTAVRQINSDLQRSAELGLSVTPAFAIGELNADGSLKVTKVMTGARPFDSFVNGLN